MQVIIIRKVKEMTDEHSCGLIEGEILGVFGPFEQGEAVDRLKVWGFVLHTEDAVSVREARQDREQAIKALRRDGEVDFDYEFGLSQSVAYAEAFLGEYVLFDGEENQKAVAKLHDLKREFSLVEMM